MSVKKIDALYLEGKEQEDSFAFYYAHLRPLLWKYARAIGYQSMNHIDDHLVDEMVDNLLMDLGSFKGDSRLSTWAYVRFRRCCITEYRYGRKNLGDSLESLREDFIDSIGSSESGPAGVGAASGEYFDPYDRGEDPTQEQIVIVDEFKQRLSERQSTVLEARLAGHTLEEIGAMLDVTSQRADQIWQQILRMAQEYGQEGLVTEPVTATNVRR